MRIRRLMPAVLLIVALGAALWAVLDVTTEGTRGGAKQPAAAEGVPAASGGPRLRGSSGPPVGTRSARKPATDDGIGVAGGNARSARREKKTSALDVRIVAPMGYLRPEVLLMAVVVGDTWVHAAEVRPDEGGWVRIELPPRRDKGPAILILDAPGFAWVTLRDIELGTHEVRYRGDVLLDRGRTIEGRVRDDRGDAVGHATVSVYPPGVPRGRIGFRYPTPRRALASGDGTFELEHAPRGSCVLRVDHGRYVARPRVVPDPTGRVTLEAHRAGHIWGSIGMEGGGGAMVLLRVEPLEPTWFEPLVDGSDEYGRIRIGPLLPGRYRVLRVMGPAPPEPDAQELAPKASPDVELGVVTVEPGKRAMVDWTLP